MTRNKKKSGVPDKTDKVTLKPIFGMQPGLYLLIFYVFILLAVCFLIFVLPGIRKNGSLIHFSTVPNGAAVFSDGTYIGSDDFSSFIEKGTHQFTFLKPGYDTVIVDEKVKGRIFFSWLFPKKDTISTTLNLISIDEYLQWRLAEIYSWSLISEFSESYYYKPVIYMTAEDLSQTENIESFIPDIQEFFAITASLIGSTEMYDDYRKALVIMDNSISGFTLEADVTQIIDAFYDNGEYRVSDYSGIENYHTYENSRAEHIGEVLFYTIPSGLVRTGNSQFEEGDALYEYPHTTEIQQFLIGAKEISEKEFCIFLQANKKWSQENIEELIDEGLVDSLYLAGIDTDNPTDFPIRNVSWFAANAYVDWLSGKADFIDAGYQAVLPTSVQWQAAAAGIESTHISEVLEVPSFFPHEPVHLFGNVWEMCSDAFLVAGSVSSDSVSLESIMDRTQKIVMGGSWKNAGDSIQPYTIGSMEPDTCSEVIGFRVAAEKVSE